MEVKQRGYTGKENNKFNNGKGVNNEVNSRTRNKEDTNNLCMFRSYFAYLGLM